LQALNATGSTHADGPRPPALDHTLERSPEILFPPTAREFNSACSPCHRREDRHSCIPPTTWHQWRRTSGSALMPFTIKQVSAPQHAHPFPPAVPTLAQDLSTQHTQSRVCDIRCLAVAGSALANRHTSTTCQSLTGTWESLPTLHTAAGGCATVFRNARHGHTGRMERGVRPVLPACLLPACPLVYLRGAYMCGCNGPPWCPPLMGTRKGVVVGQACFLCFC